MTLPSGQPRNRDGDGQQRESTPHPRPTRLNLLGRSIQGSNRSFGSRGRRKMQVLCMAGDQEWSMNLR